VVSGFAFSQTANAALPRECLLHRFGWRNEAPRQRVLAAFDPLERHRTASLKCHIL
jgi:hypothetical protein